MKRWSTGSNNYYFTCSIYLDEASWYVFALEDSIQWICHFFPRIPLPNFIKIKREGEEYTLRSWYGTTGDLFHIYVCSPIFEWCWNNTKKQTIQFPYEMLMKIFPDEFENIMRERIDDVDNDEDEIRVINKNYEYSRLVGKEFEVVYNKLKKIFDVRRDEIDKEDTIKKMNDEINSDKIIGEE